MTYKCDVANCSRDAIIYCMTTTNVKKPGPKCIYHLHLYESVIGDPTQFLNDGEKKIFKQEQTKFRNSNANEK